MRLKDRNRIPSISQYRLPHKLKEVAVDYVQKLLEAGVVRKSTSVFNSPLMLVKKPHADPNKPLADLVRVAPDCNRSYCEDSFSGYSGSV